ncbi:MAG: hypothetical protein AAF410_01560 [Pseudomonadota bacterium]
MLKTKHIMKCLCSIIVIYLVSVNHSYARMYQWVEEDTGTTQLSGKPPTWYRSQENGPRVLVFEKGRLIDDTDIEVSNKVQFELRRRAFLIAEKDEQAAKEKLAKSLEIKGAFKEEASIEDELVLVDDDSVDTDTVSADDVIDELKQLQEEKTQDENLAEQQMAERLKEMIQVWEESQKSEAMEQLE